MSYHRWVIQSTRNRAEEARFIDGDMQLITTYNVDTALEYTKYIRETEVSLSQATGQVFRHYAVAPNWVVDKAYREGWIGDDEQWKKWVEHPDNRQWKTYRKRLFALS